MPAFNVLKMSREDDSAPNVRLCHLAVNNPAVAYSYFDDTTRDRLGARFYISVIVKINIGFEIWNGVSLEQDVILILMYVFQFEEVFLDMVIGQGYIILGINTRSLHAHTKLGSLVHRYSTMIVNGRSG